MLNNSPKNFYLWDAVANFFPPDESNKNRLYAGKAWLQAARQLSRQDDEKERSEAVQEVYKEKPYPKAEHWIYADYNRVAAWAKNEPKDFIKILTY